MYDMDRPEYLPIKRDTLETFVRYAKNGIPPGDFGIAVLENNLMEAMGRADHRNRQALWQICAFVYNELPAGCHGRKGVVKEWCERVREEKNAETASG